MLTANSSDQAASMHAALRITTAALPLGAAASTASAQADPARPARIRGTVDVRARIVGQKLAERWGQPVTIDNRVGAGGNIGAAAAFAMLASVPNAVTARADFPAATLKELIAYAKANPCKVSYASQGNGATSHLSGRMLASIGGVELTHVPYKGEGPALVDRVAGRVDLFVGDISAVVRLRQEKNVKFLAVASARRTPVAIDVPTAAEAGLPGFEASAWFALVAPPGTPVQVAQKVGGAVVEALQLPDVRRKILALGGEVGRSAPGELARFIAAERIRWKRVIDSADVTVD